jgi:hypothetical protein
MRVPIDRHPHPDAEPPEFACGLFAERLHSRSPNDWFDSVGFFNGIRGSHLPSPKIISHKLRIFRLDLQVIGKSHLKNLGLLPKSS